MDIYLSTQKEALSILMAKINSAVGGEVVLCTEAQLSAYRSMEVVKRQDQIKTAEYQPKNESYDHKWEGRYEIHPDDLEELADASKPFGCIRVRSLDAS